MVSASLRNKNTKHKDIYFKRHVLYLFYFILPEHLTMFSFLRQTEPFIWVRGAYIWGGRGLYLGSEGLIFGVAGLKLSSSIDSEEQT